MNQSKYFQEAQDFFLNLICEGMFSTFNIELLSPSLFSRVHATLNRYVGLSVRRLVSPR